MCQFNDCGWCYAKDDIENNSNNGACKSPQACPQFKTNDKNVIMSTTDL